MENYKMAKLGNVNISFEIEPIMKVKCLKDDCIHNLYNRGYAACNLKYIDINPDGECEQCETKNSNDNPTY